MSKPLKNSNNKNPFTVRELELMQYMLAGKKITDICYKMKIATQTYYDKLRDIREKSKQQTTTLALIWAKENKFVSV